MKAEVGPGTFHPLGATWDGRGVNFALFSEHATGVELCLFDDEDRERRIAVPWRTLHVWHVYVPSVRPGQRYGWRVHGPFAPAEGHRFNPNKLLVDPYTRALCGAVDWQGPVYGYPRDRGCDDLVFDERDDAAHKPRCVVTEDAFDWGADAAPRVPWQDTILYELHVKGFTKLHPGIAEALRGTYLGLASEPAIAHLRSLGVTTVELLPVHECLDEPAVAARGLTNYWGYNSLAYFAPDRRLATRGGDPTREFRQMVAGLHAAGIEVVLDVVYNHTCEGDLLGPTVSLRGIDNRAYYRLREGDARRTEDYSGCGNTLDTTHPQVLKLVTDSLRYWVTDMHVDGFRFDLAPALARGLQGEIERRSAFFAVIHQDPVLSRVKLIAEPWDATEGGGFAGGFPILWAEWNGRFRDGVRDFWRGRPASVADLGYRLTGSSDLFAAGGRGPRASVNFVTAHDGFTLRDLVSYAAKHNEPNGEGNKDGADDNRSQNCGVEGETLDQEVIARRRTVSRSLLATLFVSQGVPMLEMGDELWRTQRGNSNPYCQDSMLTWVDWTWTAEARAMLEQVRALAALRKAHPVFRRGSFLTGARVGRSQGKDISWFRADGREMTGADWAETARSALAFRLDGDGVEGRASPGEPARDDSFLILMNGGAAAVDFVLPAKDFGQAWIVVVDTRARASIGARWMAGEHVEVDAGGAVVLVESPLGDARSAGVRAPGT